MVDIKAIGLDELDDPFFKVMGEKRLLVVLKFMDELLHPFVIKAGAPGKIKGGFNFKAAAASGCFSFSDNTREHFTQNGGRLNSRDSSHDGQTTSFGYRGTSEFSQRIQKGG